jgi:hypothetical protein
MGDSEQLACELWGEAPDRAISLYPKTIIIERLWRVLCLPNLIEYNSDPCGIRTRDLLE